PAVRVRRLLRECVEGRVPWQAVALAACVALAWLLAARSARWRRERKAATEVPRADDLPVEAPVVLAEVASRLDEDPRRLGELTVAAAEQRAADAAMVARERSEPPPPYPMAGAMFPSSLLLLLAV